jgi:uncharacterized membrane protein
VISALIISIWPKARVRVAEHMEHLGRLTHGRQAAWLALAYLGLFNFLFFLKYCQYRGFQLNVDTTATANLIYNFAHFRTLETTVWALPNYLAIHFMPGVASMAPILFLWNDPRALIIVQTLVVASVPVAAYLLAFRRSGSTLCGWAALWLVFTSPFFFNTASNNIVFQVALPAFFLWGAYFVETGRWMAAGACALALALTIEQTPILFFGLGLYLILKMGPRTRRAWFTGAGVCFGSALLFYFEMKVMKSYPRGGVSTGGGFTRLAPSLPALIHRAFQEPLALAGQVIFPLTNLSPLWRVMISGGFLFLFSPLEFIPFAVNFLPNLLGDGYYHDLRLHYSAYVMGPFWWVVALGLAGAYRWLDRRKQSAWLLTFALLLGAFNLFEGPNVLLHSWNRSLFSEGPELIALIPPKASVWATEYISPWVSCRPFVWSVAQTDFSSRLFVPDYVILDREWAGRTEAHYRDPILTFLAHEGYVKVSEFPSHVLLRHPRSPLANDDARPPVFVPPQPDPSAIASYTKYLTRNDDPLRAYELIRRTADQGDDHSQFEVGVMYSAGQGVGQDHDAAMKWLIKSAQQGYSAAMNSLGSEYTASGNLPEALKWFREGAVAGNAEAQYNLGVTYVLGRGVPQDVASAVGWFVKSAKQEYPPAQYNLGVCLADSQPPIRDRAQAVFWLGKAAEHGYDKAAKKLADVRANPQ